jgi:hypothetical protein
VDVGSKNLCSWCSSLTASSMVERRLNTHDIKTLTQLQRDPAWFAMLVKHTWLITYTSIIRLLEEGLGLTVRRHLCFFFHYFFTSLFLLKINRTQNIIKDPRKSTGVIVSIRDRFE